MDVPTHVNPLIEIAGTDGTLSVPNPNMFDGPLRVLSARDDDWHDLPVTGTALGRGIGIVDLIRAIRTGRPHRASGSWRCTCWT